MYETEDEKQSYRLEEKADQLILEGLRTLADAIDKRCLVHGRTRYLDKALLNKSVHLIMIYGEIETMKALSKQIGLSFSTLSRILNDNDELTANRVSVEKIIDYMYKVSDTYAKQMHK